MLTEALQLQYFAAHYSASSSLLWLLGLQSSGCDLVPCASQRISRLLTSA